MRFEKYVSFIVRMSVCFVTSTISIIILVDLTEEGRQGCPVPELHFRRFDLKKNLNPIVRGSKIEINVKILA